MLVDDVKSKDMEAVDFVTLLMQVTVKLTYTATRLKTKRQKSDLLEYIFGRSKLSMEEPNERD